MNQQFNWRGFSVLALAHVINDMYANFLPPMLPFLVSAGAFTIAKSTTLVAAFTISSSFAQPVFGYLIDQKNQRWLLFAGTLWMAVLLSMTGYTSNYYLLLILTALAGMGTSAFHPQAASMITTMGGDKKGTALSAFIAFGTIGMAIAPLILMPLFSRFGLSITGPMILPGVLAALLLYFFAPRFAKTAIKNKGSMVNVIESIKRAKGELFKLMTLVALRSLVFTGLLSLIIFFLEKERHLSVNISSIVMFIMLAAGAIGGIIGGNISDRTEKKFVIVGSFIFSTPLLLLFLKFDGLASIVFLAAGTAALMGSFSVTVVAAQEIIPENKALASGLSMGFAIGVGGLAVSFIGKYADAHGLKSALQLLFYLPLVAAIFGILLNREPKLAQMTK